MGRVAGEARLAPFVADDGFLRRTDRPRYIKNGSVFWEAFSPRKGESGLSLTYQDNYLKDDGALRQYQLYNELPHHDLPGVCRLTFSDLRDLLTPPLLPWFQDDPKDARYGSRHCLTDLPTSQEQMESMAHLDSNHHEFGLPFPLIRNEKRSRPVPPP